MLARATQICCFSRVVGFAGMEKMVSGGSTVPATKRTAIVVMRDRRAGYILKPAVLVHHDRRGLDNLKPSLV
jgi:hypothetical protein